MKYQSQKVAHYALLKFQQNLGGLAGEEPRRSASVPAPAKLSDTTPSDVKSFSCFPAIYSGTHENCRIS
jgi:hypothetical protein